MRSHAAKAVRHALVDVDHRLLVLAEGEERRAQALDRVEGNTLVGAADNIAKRVSEATNGKFQIRIFAAGEITAAILATHHNVHFYLDIMRQIREAISFGQLANLATELRALYVAGPA